MALAASADSQNSPAPKAQPAKAPDNADVVTTGVARGRGRLDSAISTSSMSQAEITDVSARSTAEIFRYIPGVRGRFRRRRRQLERHHPRIADGIDLLVPPATPR
jgi:hypothetical protein